MSFLGTLGDFIRTQAPLFSLEEKLVINILAMQLKENKERTSPKKLTQQEMVRRIHQKGEAIGCHPKWENGDPSMESTVRQLREVIRSLRIRHEIPICSDSSGYWLPLNQEQLDAYMERADKQAAASARSHIETIKVMQRRWHQNFQSQFQQMGFDFNRSPDLGHEEESNPHALGA